MMRIFNKYKSKISTSLDLGEQTSKLLFMLILADLVFAFVHYLYFVDIASNELFSIKWIVDTQKYINTLRSIGSGSCCFWL